MTETPGLVTILTVTHDRSEKVRALLASLRAAASPLVRGIVLVDDSPEPPAYAAEFPDLPLDHVVLPRRVFISEAKNLGLARVATEFVLFVDDDNVLEAAVIARLVRRLREDPHLGAVAPAVLYRGDPGLVWVYAAPFAAGRWEFELVGRNRPRDPGREDQLVPTDALPNAALVRTGAARGIGGFDRALPVNSSADFCQRLQGAGWNVRADTGAFVLHDVELPGTRAFWAAHSVDGPRLFFEVHDWFLFQRRLRRGESGVRPRALWHAVPFLLAQEIAFAIRPDTGFVAPSIVLVRGILSGLKAPLAPPLVEASATGADGPGGPVTAAGPARRSPPVPRTGAIGAPPGRRE